MVTPQEILNELKTIAYPGYTRDIVSFGIIRDIEVGTDSVKVSIAPGGARDEAIAEIRAAVETAVRDFTGVDNVEIAIEASQTPVHREPPRRAEIPGVKNVIAVASGKGGVGKSTVAVNLALALHKQGHAVGLLDADVYGPSVPLLLGVSGEGAGTDGDRIQPVHSHGIAAISLGMFIDRGQPVIWRGPMINKLLTQFFREVAWGELDYLVLDLPPGTGDAQLTIAQQAPLAGGVIVTTPQDVALLDVQRGIAMLHQVGAPVLGVVENMSFHICPDCGHRSEIFGHGGGRKMASESDIAFLGEIPLARRIRETSDAGQPIVISEPDGEHAKAFDALATRVRQEVEKAGRLDLPLVN